MPVSFWARALFETTSMPPTLLLGYLTKLDAIALAAGPEGGPERLPKIFWIEPADVEMAHAIIRRYSDKNWSLTDVTSSVLMERYRIGIALTTDHNFAQYGFGSLVGDTNH
jgi:hypothetical protein